MGDALAASIATLQGKMTGVNKRLGRVDVELYQLDRNVHKIMDGFGTPGHESFRTDTTTPLSPLSPAAPLPPPNSAHYPTVPRSPGARRSDTPAGLKRVTAPTGYAAREPLRHRAANEPTSRTVRRRQPSHATSASTATPSDQHTQQRATPPSQGARVSPLRCHGGDTNDDRGGWGGAAGAVARSLTGHTAASPESHVPSGSGRLTGGVMSFEGPEDVPTPSSPSQRRRAAPSWRDSEGTSPAGLHTDAVQRASAQGPPGLQGFTSGPVRPEGRQARRRTEPVVKQSPLAPSHVGNAAQPALEYLSRQMQSAQGPGSGGMPAPALEHTPRGMQRPMSGSAQRSGQDVGGGMHPGASVMPHGGRMAVGRAPASHGTASDVTAVPRWDGPAAPTADPQPSASGAVRPPSISDRWGRDPPLVSVLSATSPPLVPLNSPVVPAPLARPSGGPVPASPMVSALASKMSFRDVGSKFSVDAPELQTVLSLHEEVVSGVPLPAAPSRTGSAQGVSHRSVTVSDITRPSHPTPLVHTTDTLPGFGGEVGWVRQGTLPVDEAATIPKASKVKPGVAEYFYSRPASSSAGSASSVPGVVLRPRRGSSGSGAGRSSDPETPPGQPPAPEHSLHLPLSSLPGASPTPPVPSLRPAGLKRVAREAAEPGPTAAQRRLTPARVLVAPAGPGHSDDAAAALQVQQIRQQALLARQHAMAGEQWRHQKRLEDALAQQQEYIGKLEARQQQTESAMQALLHGGLR